MTQIPRRIPRRTFLAGTFGAGLGLSLAACGKDDPVAGGTDGGKATTVSIGYIADFNGASMVAVADDRKLWAKHGLRPSLKVFTNGPLQVQALNAGDLDFGYLGPGALWLPAAGQAKIVAVNSVGLADRVIAKPGIATIAGLRGKTVGVPDGTSGDMILRLALARAGVAIGDVKKVSMDPSTVVTAFGSGQIDAAGIWYPLIDTIKRRVPNLVELARNEEFAPGTTFPTVFVARNQVAAQNPGLVKKMVALIREANDYRAAHVQPVVATTAKFLKVPEANLASEAKNVRLFTSAELAASTRDGSITRWLTNLNELFVSFGKLDKPADPAGYYLADAYLSAT